MDSEGRPSLGGQRCDGVDLDPADGGALVSEAGAVGGNDVRESQSDCGLLRCEA